jgi:hypothetical protein
MKIGFMRMLYGNKCPHNIKWAENKTMYCCITIVSIYTISALRYFPIYLNYSTFWQNKTHFYTILTVSSTYANILKYHIQGMPTNILWQVSIRLNNFRHYKVFDKKKIPGCMTYVVI